MSHKAWQNAHAMYENDACAKALGIDIISMDEGFAVVTMTVTAQMLNGHQSCHGGQLFSLADTAFAYACNSQGLAAVASACTIDFLRPGFAGDTLTATARYVIRASKPVFTTSKLLTNNKKRLRCFAVNLTASAAPLQEKPDA